MKEKTSTIITVRIDKKVKIASEALFKKLGLTLSSAINIFLRASIRKQGLPFDVVVDSELKKKAFDTIEETNKLHKTK